MYRVDAVVIDDQATMTKNDLLAATNHAIELPLGSDPSIVVELYREGHHHHDPLH